LESSYKSKGNLDEAKQMSQKALDFAKEYKTDIVYNKYWKPIISKIESDLK